jgi:hypothetical protein
MSTLWQGWLRTEELSQIINFSLTREECRLRGGPAWYGCFSGAPGCVNKLFIEKNMTVYKRE